MGDVFFTNNIGTMTNETSSASSLRKTYWKSERRKVRTVDVNTAGNIYMYNKDVFFKMYTSVFSKVVVLLLDTRREYALQV